MRFTLKISRLIICFCFLNCNNPKTNNGMITIKGTIGAYTANASHDNFGDGSFTVYDAVKIAVIQPKNYKNKELTIFLSKEETNDSFWREKGHTISFNINSRFLEDSIKIYAGALENIKMQ